MRRVLTVLGLALAALGVPAAASAQTYCGAPGYPGFVPTGYSPYTGFASYPGAVASGAVPSNYATNPYSGCGVASSYSSNLPYTYSANTYNPWSPWGTAGSGTYGYNQSVSSAYSSPTGYGSAYPYNSVQPSWTTPYTGFAGYPGGPTSGYGGTAQPTYLYGSGGYGTSAAASYGTSAATPSYGYSGTQASWTTPYTGFAGYPGATTSGYGSAAQSSYGYGTAATSPYGFGTTGYGSYSNPVPTSLLTWGCGSGQC